MFINGYIKFITTYFRVVIVAVVFLTALFAHYSLKLSIDASAETLLLEDDRDLQLTREVHGRYKSQDFLFVSFTPKEYLLSDKTLKTIKSLKSEILKIDGVDSITTILDVPLLESPKRGIKDIVGETITLESKSVDRSLAQKELTSSPLYAENLVSKDFKSTALVINLKDDAKYTELLNARNQLMEKQKSSKLNKEESERLEAIKLEFKAHRDMSREKTHILIKSVRAVLHAHKSDGELFLGGAMMAADDMIGFVKNDIEVYGSAVLAIMVLILWVIFRQIRFVILPILISFVAVVVTVGVCALVGLEVTVISSNFVSMQLITTLSLVIHLIVCFREQQELHPDFSQKELIASTLERMATPSLFVILTSVAGFSSLMTCDILPIINLGHMMNIGVSVSLAAAYLLFPAIMMMLPKKKPVLTFDKYFTLNRRFASIVEHHRLKILAVVVTMALFSLFGATRLIVENSFINYFKESTEIYQGMKKIDEHLGGTTPLEIVVRFPKAQDSGTKDTNSGALDSFEDEFAESKNSAQYWFTPQKMESILKIHEYLDSIPEIGNVSSLGTLIKVGRILKEGKDLDNFELALMYNELPQAYKEIILSPYINIQNDEARFVIRIKDSAKELRRDELLKKIDSDLKDKLGLESQNYELVGMMVLYNNMLQSLFDSQISTLGIALLTLGGMFLFLFRSLKIAMLAMTVNMVPISIIFGIMGVANIPLDMMSITIASIALGITVDNTIHYYYRFREEIKLDGDYIKAMHRSHSSIAFGMFYYSIATIVGFLVLITSNFIPTLIFGLLTVIVLVVAITSDLLFSPLLVVLFKPFGLYRK